MAATNEVQQLPAVHLTALLDVGDGAVVTLEAGETQLVAHRAVLAARSPVFAALLQPDPLEASSGHVTITDVEGPVLREMLAYCYTLQVPQLPSMAPQLLAAADKYGLTDLKGVCEQQVAAQLTVENAAATAVLALSHSCPVLKQAAVEFLRGHTDQVMMTQGWADTVVSHPQSAAELTSLITEPPAEASVPDIKRRRLSPTTEHHSSHDQTPDAAPAPTARHHTPPPEDPAVSYFRSFAVEERVKPLLQAAKLGAVRQLRALLAAGVDVGVRGKLELTALHYAAHGGHEEAAKCLIAAGAQVDARNSVQNTPLHFAAAKGHVAVAQLLLAFSADPNARNHVACTPLHYAATFGQPEVAAALVKAGADRGARSCYHTTPLDVVNQKNRQQLIQILTQ